MTQNSQQPAITVRSRGLPGTSIIGKHLESIGYGLLGAGVVLLALACLGTYIRGGLVELADAAYPLAPQNYLVLLSLVPGCAVIWLGRKMAGK